MDGGGRLRLFEAEAERGGWRSGDPRLRSTHQQRARPATEAAGFLRGKVQRLGGACLVAREDGASFGLFLGSRPA